MLKDRLSIYLIYTFPSFIHAHINVVISTAIKYAKKPALIMNYAGFITAALINSFNTPSIGHT
jgi:hypothetical protein